MLIKTEYEIWKEWFGKDKSKDKTWIESTSLLRDLHKQFHGMDGTEMIINWIKKESNLNK